MTEWDARAQRIAVLLENRYELLERLGQGGFASVYKVRNLRLRRIEALKVLAVTLTEEGDFSQRFEQEARFSASLDHPNIAKIYDYGGEGDLFWFSMQFVDGPTLRRQLNEGGPIDPVRAGRIAVGVLDALSYSHGRGIIHRDIKPDNIQLDSSRRPYLMDFGIAKSEDSSVKTQTGFIFGSPAYMSPEQIKGETLDPRTDLYSLGVTLYAMLSGSLPFSADDTFAAAMKKLSEPPAPLSEKVPDIPPDLEEIVMRSLARAREERFQSAVEMRDAVGEFLDRTRQAAAQDRTPTAPLRVQPSLAAGRALTPAAARQAGSAPGADLDATTALPRTVTPPSLLLPDAPAGGKRTFIVVLLVVLAMGVLLIVWFSRPGREADRRAAGASPAVSPKVAPEGAVAGVAAPAAAPEATEVPPAPPTQLPSPIAPPAVRADDAAATPGPAAAATAQPARPTAPQRATARPPRARPSPEPRIAALRATPSQEAPPSAGDLPPGVARAREAKYLPEPDPRYPIDVPSEIKKDHARESVGLMVTVAEDGTVKNAKVISAVCPECDYAVLQAVRKSRFKPGRDAEGRPVEATFAFSYRF